jgi:hypothetical protein
MQTIQTPITGKEPRTDQSLPYTALVQFYFAFNNQDLEAMQLNWHQSDESVMDNPLGGIKRGWQEIRPVYEQIFQGLAKVYVEFYDYSIRGDSAIFYAIGRERGYFAQGEIKLDLAIRTTRIYRRIGQVWQQVHHHGSIEDPGLLERYQAAVGSKPVLL